jgi:hypothetical protein
MCVAMSIAAFSSLGTKKTLPPSMRANLKNSCKTGWCLFVVLPQRLAHGIFYLRWQINLSFSRLGWHSQALHPRPYSTLHGEQLPVGSGRLHDRHSSEVTQTPVLLPAYEFLSALRLSTRRYVPVVETTISE